MTGSQLYRVAPLMHQFCDLVNSTWSPVMA